MDIKDSLPAKEDTFLTIPLHESPDYFQQGLVMDSIKWENLKVHRAFAAWFPRMDEKKYPNSFSWIRNLIQERLLSFKTIPIDEEEYDSNSYSYESYKPKLLYEDERVLSIVMSESSYGDHRYPYWDHHSFNYDVARKREIQLGDYFILETRSDTAFLQRFLHQALAQGNSNFHIELTFPDLLQECAFGIDSSNIYFFFGRFAYVGYGDYVSYVPKKYIMNHIRPEYQ